MKILQVSEFIEIVNLALREMWAGEELAVEGEVSGYRISQGQWVSFDLKDDKALVNVFMPVWNLRVPIEDGLKVRVIGFPRIYPKYGKFSLSAERLELVGEGALKRALALLRLKLEKEGLFDPSRKRPLPRFPERIALIASRESAAYGDFIRILAERWGGLEIDVYHVLVQGERAPKNIVSAIIAAQEKEYDALVMTRGGGSLEELMAFNDEQVVRAIHASRIPTLVAIGHERDLTLAEEAADVRGSTPTDCARRLVPDRRDVQFELSTLLTGIEQSLKGQIEHGRGILEHACSAPMLWLQHLREDLAAHIRLITSLNPRAVLSRGYAMIRDEAGQGITTISRVRIGQPATIVLHDGEADTVIKQINKFNLVSSPRRRGSRPGFPFSRE